MLTYLNGVDGVDGVTDAEVEGKLGVGKEEFPWIGIGIVVEVPEGKVFGLGVFKALLGITGTIGVGDEVVEFSLPGKVAKATRSPPTSRRASKTSTTLL